MQLRPYQQQIINQVKQQLLQGAKSICVVAPCGAGKSVIQAMIAKSAALKKNKVLFLVHRKELCVQIEETFAKCGVDFNYCKIAMVQTVTRNLESEPCPSVIITDENHHCLATSYTNIYDRFSDAIKLGFTATPVRMGGVGLGKIYNKLVGDIKIKWLIENKYLSPYRLYSKKLVDTTELHTQRGDYNKKETESLMGTRVIYGETVKTYNELAAGKKTIVYCAGIDSSTATRDAFIKTGINACHLDANTPKQERLEAVAKFRAGEILVLCNVDLFSEGEYQSPCIVKAV